MIYEIHSNGQSWIDRDKLESALRYDREDMAQVIQSLMSDQTTKEEILGLSGVKLEVLADLLQEVSILIVVRYYMSPLCLAAHNLGLWKQSVPRGHVNATDAEDVNITSFSC